MESKFVPVCLTTLNRVDKLKVCLESLARCRYACDTEIFISVDYPPNENYVGGYEKVISYLNNYLQSSFKKMHIIYQNTNIGAFKNAYYIIDKALEHFDNFLIIEDDNEFADDALRYYNYFLKIYGDDKNIMFIAGDNKLMIWEDKIVSVEPMDKVILAQWTGYGLAGWKDKFLRLRKLCEEGSFEKQAMRLKNAYKLSKKSAFAFYYLVENIVLRNSNGAYTNGNLYMTDGLINIYLLLNDHYVILPGYSRIMNHGFDGSGLHCKNNMIIQSYIFDKNTLNIALEKDNIILDNALIKQIDEISGARGGIIRTWIKYFAFKMLGLKRVIWLLRKIRREKV